MLILQFFIEFLKLKRINVGVALVLIKLNHKEKTDPAVNLQVCFFDKPKVIHIISLNSLSSPRLTRCVP